MKKWIERLNKLDSQGFEGKHAAGVVKIPAIAEPEGKFIQLQNCPAKCKRTGRCYGIAYFDAKPGKALLCIPDQCLWSDQLKQHFNIKDFTNGK